MKTEMVTVRVDRELKPTLDKVCRRTGRSRSAIVREALARYLALAEFEELRRKGIPYAERKGYFTDEDIFEDVS